MNDYQEERRILWLVWSLVALACGVGLVSIGLVWWTLSEVQEDRVRLMATEAELLEIGELVERLGRDFGLEVEKQLNAQKTVQEDPTILENLEAFIEKHLEETNVEEIHPALMGLKTIVVDLKVLWLQVLDWRKNYEGVLDDLTQQKSLRGVRHQLQDIRGALETLEGTHRLQRAIQFQQWRSSQGQKAARLAEEIVLSQNDPRIRSLTDIKLKVADLSNLVEVLAGEEQSDHLVDIKDNKLKPSFSRLSRSLKALEGMEGVPPELGGARPFRNLVWPYSEKVSSLMKPTRPLTLGAAGCMLFAGMCYTCGKNERCGRWRWRREFHKFVRARMKLIKFYNYRAKD